MNKIFHARIHFAMYILIAILTVGACVAFWHKMAIYGTIMLLFLIVVIERIIHTTYTITNENELIVYYGRFMRKQIIPIQSIIRIEKCRHLRFSRHCLLSYLLVIYGNGKYVSVMPVKEDEFLETLTKNRRKVDVNNQTNPKN